MLNRFDLKNYRVLRNLTLRDVARYCDITFEAIGQVERGEINVTKHNHDEIVKGINRASQAKVNGTFEEDKLKTEAKKETSSKNTTAKRTTTRKSTKADTK